MPFLTVTSPASRNRARPSSARSSATRIFGIPRPYRQSLRFSTDSTRALATQDHRDRAHDDVEVEQEAHVLDVVEVVAQLLLRILDRRAVRVAHLGPTREPRLDRVP